MSQKEKAFGFALFVRVFKLIRPYKSRFILTFFLLLFLSIVTPARPWLIQYTVDKAIMLANKDLLVFLLIANIGLLVFESAVRYFFNYYTTWLGQHAIFDLRKRVYNHIMSQKLKFFDKTAIGVLTTRTVTDIETVAQIFSEGILTISGDILQLIAILGVMLFTNWKLTIVSLATIPILLIASYIFKESVKKSFIAVRKNVSLLNAFSQEHLTGMHVIQQLGQEDLTKRKFNKINSDLNKANLNSVMAYSIFFPIVEIVNAISLGLIIWYGASQVLKDNITTGEIIAFIMYIGLVFRPIRMLADRFNSLQMGLVASERIFDLIDTKEHIEQTGSLFSTPLKGKIEFKNVYFSYNSDQQILKNISFEIKPGSFTAIIGSTGSGKTSIINILSRFYDYDSGEIIIDDISIKNWDVQKLRNQFAVIPQDVFLFSGTIFENIALFDKNITKVQVLDLIHSLDLNGFINSLESGLDYKVMERGGALSTGQRQLVAFIRAMLNNPELIILDEATSSIDSETERLIQNATQKIIKNRTSIVIAHRLSTIIKADQILVLDHGKIIERGNHQELMALQGHYTKFYDNQFQTTKLEP